MPEPQKTELKGREEDTYRSAGSYGQEVQEDIAGETMGEGAGTEPHGRGSNGEKESPDTAGTNPKRTENSRPN